MRKEITKFLSDTLLRTELWGNYFASEVTIDYGLSHPKRVDFMRFVPNSTVYMSDIEKGIFICYEVKSCVEDIYSGNGLNFYGEKNYIVTTMETYKKLIPDIRSGKLDNHIKEANPESSLFYGVMVAVPESRSLEEEFFSPTSLDVDVKWEFKKIVPCNGGSRRRSITELLFCMLRSGAAIQ